MRSLRNLQKKNYLSPDCSYQIEQAQIFQSDGTYSEQGQKKNAKRLKKNQSKSRQVDSSSQEASGVSKKKRIRKRPIQGSPWAVWNQKEDAKLIQLYSQFGNRYRQLTIQLIKFMGNGKNFEARKVESHLTSLLKFGLDSLWRIMQNNSGPQSVQECLKGRQRFVFAEKLLRAKDPQYTRDKSDIMKLNKNPQLFSEERIQQLIKFIHIPVPTKHMNPAHRIEYKKKKKFFISRQAKRTHRNSNFSSKEIQDQQNHHSDNQQNNPKKDRVYDFANEFIVNIPFYEMESVDLGYSKLQKAIGDNQQAFQIDQRMLYNPVLKLQHSGFQSSTMNQKWKQRPTYNTLKYDKLFARKQEKSGMTLKFNQIKLNTGLQNHNFDKFKFSEGPFKSLYISNKNEFDSTDLSQKAHIFPNNFEFPRSFTNPNNNPSNLFSQSKDVNQEQQYRAQSSDDETFELIYLLQTHGNNYRRIMQLLQLSISKSFKIVQRIFLKAIRGFQSAFKIMINQNYRKVQTDEARQMAICLSSKQEHFKKPTEQQQKAKPLRKNLTSFLVKIVSDLPVQPQFLQETYTYLRILLQHLFPQRQNQQQLNRSQAIQSESYKIVVQPQKKKFSYKRQYFQNNIPLYEQRKMPILKLQNDSIKKNGFLNRLIIKRNLNQQSHQSSFLMNSRIRLNPIKQTQKQQVTGVRHQKGSSKMFQRFFKSQQTDSKMFIPTQENANKKVIHISISAPNYHNVNRNVVSQPCQINTCQSNGSKSKKKHYEQSPTQKQDILDFLKQGYDEGQIDQNIFEEDD